MSSGKKNKETNTSSKEKAGRLTQLSVPAKDNVYELEDYTPSSGLQAIEHSVQFTAHQVLEPDAKPIKGAAKPIADQAAAMMIEDVRSFLQSNEAILAAAAAQAMKLLLNQETQKIGENALKQIAEYQGKITKFTGSVISEAGKVSKEFE